MWHPVTGGGLGAPVGSCHFRHALEIPAGRKVVQAKMRLTADNEFVLQVNGQEAARGNSFAQSYIADLTPWLHSGTNMLAVTATNGGQGPNPAGLIGRYWVTLDDSTTLSGPIDSQWRSSDRAPEGWTSTDFDDETWSRAETVVAFGDKPWGTIDGAQWLTLSPVKANPFSGRFSLPAELLEHRARICIEAEQIEPEGAAAVRVNGRYAGGFIGRPYRLDISAQVKPGENRIEVEPFAPTELWIVVSPTEP